MLRWLTFALLCIAWNSASALDPRVNWETLHTPHFDIHFDSRHYELAAKYALYAEQAYQTTTQIFSVAPTKTSIVIQDSSDLANGFAMGIPYAQITSYPVLPSALDIIGDYQDWGYELLAHEYTHILNFEPTEGWFKPLRYIFGSIIKPNMLLPNWYLEGLAVYTETRLSRGGRLRSPNYLAIARAMTRDNRLFEQTLALDNEIDTPDYPGGNRPYIFGSLLWRELMSSSATNGELINKLNLSYGGHLPFLVDGPLIDHAGRGWDDQWSMTFEALEKKSLAEIDTIKKASPFQGRKLDQVGFYNHSPSISAAGKRMLFVSRTHNEDSRIEIFERNTPQTPLATLKAMRVLSTNFTHRASWEPTAKSFVYDNIDTYDRYYAYSDLYRYDIDTKKIMAITRGARATEPAVSPDGQWIAFVQNYTGGTRLAIVKRDGTDLHTLYDPGIQQRVSWPEFIANDEIIFSERQASATAAPAATGKPVVTDVLKKIKITDEKPKTVLEQFANIRFAKNTREGILFTSSDSGVTNIYLSSADFSKIRAISNTTTSIVNADIDPLSRDLLYSELDSDGPHIYSIAATDWRKQPESPPKVQTVEPIPALDPTLTPTSDLAVNPTGKPTVYPTVTPPTANSSAQAPLDNHKEAASLAQASQIERTTYQPLHYLYPHYWIPFIYFMPGGTYLSASTSMQDPVGINSIGLEASYDSLTNSPGFFVDYVNRSTVLTSELVLSQYSQYLYAGNLKRDNTNANILTKSFIWGLSNKWAWTAGLSFLKSSIEDVRLQRAGPSIGFQYSDLSQKGEEISPEKGGSVSASHTHYIGSLGDVDYDRTDVLSSAYWSKWLPSRHVLAGYLNFSLAPRLSNSFFGQSTASAGYQTALTQSAFLLRGYSAGNFLAKNMVNATVEYRFPLAYLYRGWSTAPIFLKRWHAALFCDATTFDGIYYNYEDKLYHRANIGRYFVGTGAELKADLTLFYHMPVSLILGAYYGTDRETGLGFYPFFGFSI